MATFDAHKGDQTLFDLAVLSSLPPFPCCVHIDTLASDFRLGSRKVSRSIRRLKGHGIGIYHNEAERRVAVQCESWNLVTAVCEKFLDGEDDKWALAQVKRTMASIWGTPVHEPARGYRPREIFGSRG
jgi:hypothetical protein